MEFAKIRVEYNKLIDKHNKILKYNISIIFPEIPSDLFTWDLSQVYVWMAQELSVSVQCPPSLHAAPRGIRVLTCLPLSHNSMYHVISPSSICLERKPSI
jgi:hypothetical protein